MKSTEVEVKVSKNTVYHNQWSPVWLATC